MIAAIYNPYLDTLGGGERYTVGVIKAFLNANYKVHIQWDDEQILEKLEQRFAIALPDVKIKPSIQRGDGYDACFWVSDGSIPNLLSRNNILHFQVPFSNVNGKTLINKMKLFRVKHIIVNSEFTKNVIDKSYGVKSQVLYPPVSVSEFKPRRKQNQICYIGRFSKLAQLKRQDVLIDVFKKFHKSRKNWKLILAGGTEVGTGSYVQRLKLSSKGYPVEIVESPSFSQIQEILGTSKMFWSAAGYNIDENKYPEKVEHFGITVVEAMAAKAIPVVFKGGGFKEIVTSGKTGFLWNTKKELLDIASNLEADYKLMSQIARSTQEASKNFSADIFEERFKELL